MWRIGKYSVFTANWLALFALAVALPDSLTDSPTLRQVVAAIAAAVPAVPRVAMYSSIPDVAQAFWALALLLSLAALPFYFRLSDEQVKSFESAVRNHVAYRIGVIVILGVIIYAVLLPFLGRIGQVMLDSRLGLGVFGGLIFAALPFMIRALVTWWRYQGRLDEATKGGNSG